VADEQQLRSYLKRVTIELAEERKRLHAYRHEPIAIVGISCRFPGGVSSPAELWELLAEGRDAIGEFPTDRGWDVEGLYHPDPDNLGTSYTREGGFLHDAAEFDPAFFGISPRDALIIDPQQRLLLEASWEALEHAGIDPRDLRGTPAGIFAGVSSLDYNVGNDDDQFEGHRLGGMATSILSGRVAYTLGLEGPAMTVDTACSSSLVTLHLASQALRAGECDLALAGGVTVLATSTAFVELSRQRGLSPDGRCKAFADVADGVGWAEGVGVLALERLSVAEAKGHNVLATIRGSAVNQDGASNGLTAPNGPSQERVIRQALANARLTPQDIDVVEAHGTGTTLGDPIEAGALLATYGQEREKPLKLGSVKSNIGHTQAAAGVAGVIKAVMAMREGVLPKTLHVDAPSSKVDWEAGEIELLTEAVEWKPNGHPRRAGVSSFGASGTNAHLILEEGPEAPAEREGEGMEPHLSGSIPFVLSAKTEEALEDSAARLAAHLQARPELEPADLSFSLATTRSTFERRAVLLAGDRQELLAGLAALAQGKEADNLLLGSARSERRPAFCFPGQGSQHQGMALELLDSSERFAAHMRECEEALSPFVDWSLEEVLREEDAAWLDRLDILQPALFATMVSLARLWRECGVEPAVVLGHSQGEIAAAHVAGGLSLEDATRIVALRAKALTKIAGKGAVLSVSIPEAELPPLIEPYGERVSLAALNGPASLVISGEPKAIEELLADCERQGIRTRSVAIDCAAHSAQIDALEEELLEAFAPISPRSGEIPFHSTLTGELTDIKELGPAYWYRNLRETVRLEPAVRSLLEQGQRTLIEVGPHPMLAFALQETVDDVLADPEEASVIATLRREEQSERRFALSLAAAHASGAKLDWPTFFKDTGAKAVPLPTYPFQRERFWLLAASGAGDPSAAGQASAGHPLLSAVVADPDGGIAFTGRISIQTHPWLADHAAAGVTLLPGTAFVELALRAGSEAGCEQLEELVLQAPLPIPEAGGVALRVSLSPEGDGGERELSIHSRTEAGPDEEPGEWVLHAQGVLSAAAAELGEPLASWPPDGAELLAVEDAYERFAELGLDYGPAFQGLTAAWRLGEEIYAEVSLAEEQKGEAARFAVHPALLDSALHGGLELMSGSAAGPGASGMMLPFAWTGIRVASPGLSSLRVRLAMQEGPLALAAFDEANAPVLAVASVVGRAISPEQLGGQRPRRKDLLSLRWEEVSPVATQGALAKLVSLPELGAEREADTARAAHAATGAALALIQATLAEEAGEGEEPTRLALLTEGAVAARPGEDPDPAAAAVWGLWRSAQSENPGRFALIDSDGSDASGQEIARALAASAAEPQLALREGELLAPRISDEPGPGAGLVPPEGPWRLDAPKRGSMEGLELVAYPAAEEPLPEGTVRLALRAAGVNFRDIVVVLGFDVTGGAMLGAEGAGIVTEVGPGAEGLAVGDRVMGLVPSAFAPTAVAAARALVKIPADWSFEQAASVPSVYCTASYGLFDLAELKPGEKVLIHAGAGGVGSAAIALAQRQGAEVFATASPSKWDALRAAGVADDHIASSRELDFKERFLAATDGEGVDVVLNSLAGEYVDASLALLPGGGRFLEMGKTDIRDPEAVAAAHPGVSYRAYDLGEVGVERIGEMLGELSQRLQGGELPFPALTTWDVRRAPEAFRHLREGKNVGKIVLEIPTAIDPECTVLISGATGTIGSLVARHLVEAHGARHLLLAGRSGPAAEGAAELVAELEGLGASVRTEACDVSSREQVEALIDSIDPERPLGAIVHAAGVLEDGVVAALTPEQLERVLAPKVDGAWNLHELSKQMDLSAFLMFSSMAGTIGGPGQGNYAAANVFMDALAQHRQAQGLAATSIAWGMWESESAMTGDLDEQDKARARRFGAEEISDERGMELLDAVLARLDPLVIAAPVDRGAFARMDAAGMLPPILSDLLPRRSQRRKAPSSSLAERLGRVPEAEREAVVLELVREEAAAVLGHSSAKEVAPQRPFSELGFDSLATVELRNRLGEATGMRLAATLVFDYPSPAELAAHLLERASGASGAPQAVLRAQGSDEPIAIVGIACRYPGAVKSPEQLWSLVEQGRDAIGEFPSDRGWDVEGLYHPDPDHPGTSYTREGGFVYDAADFDPAFFGISPREALIIDPQQRLLLEASWEAFEHAGIDPLGLRGTQTGIFAGVSSLDYSAGLIGAGEEYDGHRLIGMTASVVSGRVSYTLGLEGPAMSIDTACSSSLVAIHLAAQALRGGECSLALAGGVTVLATPTSFREFSRQRGLAPDGRCKPFAEAADGTGWAEGVGVLALERLSDAEANGHRVLATVCGSAVNQDGASNGLTAPNGPSQERVIRQALANAGLQPADVDAVEAHGTGTMLGDPIEAGALLATYGQERETPLRLGSIKSNIGHSQAAAGVGGVIKTVMAMREGVLPKTLHLDAPSSKVDWAAGKIELLSEASEWKPNGRLRRAGVSSFGVSGTNAHVILEEAPRAAVPDAQREQIPGPIPLLLSAKSEAALREAAARLATHLRECPELELTDVSYSLATTRAQMEMRAVVVAEEREEALEALDALAKGEPSPHAHRASAKHGRLALLFTGQGSQRPGMGKELYETYPAYARALDEACEQIDRHLDLPLKDILFAEPGSKEAELLDHTTYAQPALFATELAVYRLLESFGLKGDLLTGHSVGEIVAAHIAGVFSLADAARLICARGALMGALPKGGAMLAIEASEAEALAAIEGKEELLSLAAINSPNATVISGAEQAIEELDSHFQDQGRKTKRLAVSHAFHSPLIEPMLEEFREVVASLALAEPGLPVISNLSGETLAPEQATDPAYWVAHAREPVRFADAVNALEDKGATAYLEIGPEAVLTAMAAATLGQGEKAALIPSLREGRAEPRAIALCFAAAHASGAKLDWSAYFKGTGAKAVPLPTYPFQRKRYWLSAPAGAGDPTAVGQTDAEHPLLGATIEDPDGGLALTGRISTQTHPWLSDHVAGGVVLLPGTAFVELALRAGQEVGCERLEELVLQAPLPIPEAGGVALRVSLSPEGERGERELSIHSRTEAGPDEGPGEWVLHAQGVLLSATPESGEPLEAWPPAGAESLAVDDAYERLAYLGFDYGPAFQGLTAAWKLGEEVYAEVSLAEEQKGEAARFGVHPALLDSALHGGLELLASAGGEPGASGIVLPFAWTGVQVQAPGRDSLRVRLAMEGSSFALTAFDEANAPVLNVASMIGRVVSPEQLGGQKSQGKDLFSLAWVQAPQAPSQGALAKLVSLPELGAEREADIARAAHAATRAALELIQATLAEQAGEGEEPTRLALLTEGAVAARPGEDPDPAAAAVWGLWRSAQSENPGRFALIDSDGSDASQQAISKALALSGAEPQLALRAGELLAPRVSDKVVLETPTAIDPERTVLITGATGTLGSLLARHLVERHGSHHLLLVGRSGPAAEGATELVQELEGMGASVRIEACDVSSRESVQASISSIDPEHPLGAVIHVAGVIEDGLVTSLGAAQLQRVLAPKVDGAWNLHELSKEMGLTAFVTFSSMAGTIGGPGQGNYAAANVFMDALAQHRRTQGLAATSIAWGKWASESAMTGDLDEADKARARRVGVEEIIDECGLELFDTALASLDPLVLATPVDRAALARMDGAGMLPPILRGLLPRRAQRRKAPIVSLSERLARVPEAEREAALLELVREEVAAILGHASAEEVPPERPFSELGFDSLAAVEMRNRLGAMAGAQMPITLIFDYPSAAALAAFLLAEFNGENSEEVPDDDGRG
jgi:polyene macrolide polyketide synthase